MTEDQVAALFDELGVRRSGHFALSSGAHSDTYLQCAAALAQPRMALHLGRALAERVTRAGVGADAVASPALGGVLAGFAVAAALDRRFVFAERTADGNFALRRGQTVTPQERILVVEDVVTSGGSAREVADLITQQGASVVGLASLVDRSNLPEHQRPVSLLHVDAGIWDAGACPLCAAGTPLDRPGSRLLAARRHKV